mgnify:CR=1 FL=1
MNQITMLLAADKFIRLALEEDINSEDVTTNSVMPQYKKGEVQLICKENGIVAGLGVFERVFTLLDPETKVIFDVKDGDEVKKGQHLATVVGDIRVLLSGERTALNYLQRMSGIATYTNKVVKMLEGTKTVLLDTRKTTPLLRLFERQAVRDGGGTNHRYNLSDRVLIKDNHIAAVGSITEAVELAKKKVDPSILVEVEVETKEEFLEALETKCDIIMLDNMDNEMMRELVEINKHKKKLEASGNMSLKRVRSVAMLGVDYISVGALTHSYKSLDISLKFYKGI